MGSGELMRHLDSDSARFCDGGGDIESAAHPTANFTSSMARNVAAYTVA